MKNINHEPPMVDMQDQHIVPADSTIAMIEDLFATFSGFKKSEILRRKIKKVIEGRSNEEVLAWLNNIMLQGNNTDIAALAEDLTNNETYFFRDIIQFETFEKDILPHLVKKKIKNNDRTVRIWSAACSTGEEAYSLAIITLEYMFKHDMARWDASGNIRFLDGWNIKVFGTDISRQVIKIARNGLYSSRGLSSFRDFPPKYYGYFHQKNVVQHTPGVDEGHNYEIRNAIKQLMYFERFNLLSSELPLFLKNIDVVFCRNMMIYIEIEAQKRMQKIFHDALVNHGYLVMSAVDNVHDTKRFASVRLGDNIIYQRR